MSKYLTTNETAVIKDWRTDREWQQKKADPPVPRCSFCKSIMSEDWQVAGEHWTVVSYICPNSCMRESRFHEKVVKRMDLLQRLNIKHQG